MANQKIKLIAEKTLASDSLDHTDPVGSISDNSTNHVLIDEIESYFDGKKINFMDVGCAGGQFVVDMISRDFTKNCVGIEGSDAVFDGPGKDNWEKYLNKNLFFCDASEPYSFKIGDDEDLKFDLIFSTDVIEHISNHNIDQFVDNMFNSLTPTGMIVLSIGLCDKDPRHVTILSKEGWEERLSNYNVNKYPFQNTLRTANDNTHFLCLKKSK